MNPGLRGCGLGNSRGPKPRIITMLDYAPKKAKLARAAIAHSLSKEDF